MKTKTKVILMRGIPSCGKSTRAIELARCYDGVIVSADEYWYLINNPLMPDKYSFDFSKINQAHQYCFDKFVDALVNGEKCVVVDNTNITRKHMKRYIEKAKEFDCEITIEYPTSFWWKEVRKLLENKDENNETNLKVMAMYLSSLSKSTHNVSNEVILKMMKDWENDIEI